MGCLLQLLMQTLSGHYIPLLREEGANRLIYCILVKLHFERDPQGEIYAKIQWIYPNGSILNLRIG